MIHLRKFNESDNQDYYAEISHDKFEDVIWGMSELVGDFDKMSDFYTGKIPIERADKFTEREIKVITSILHNIPNIDSLANSDGFSIDLKRESQLDIIGWDSKNYFNSRSIESKNGKYKLTLGIVKLKDGWFYTNVNFCGTIAQYPHKGKCYECDQFDGLKLFLKTELPKLI